MPLRGQWGTGVVTGGTGDAETLVPRNPLDAGHCLSQNAQGAGLSTCGEMHTGVGSAAVRLESEIVIDRGAEEVWRFLGSVSNIARWDRGVARTRTTHSQSDSAVGMEFDTFAKNDGDDWGRMSYRVVRAGADSCTVALTSTQGNARFFKDAGWTFRTAPHPQGTLLTCAADFSLRLSYIFLAPILYLKKDALAMDLASLKRAIESE